MSSKKRMRRIPALVGDKSELLLKPLRNLDVSKEGFEGLHQLRVFLDVTPGVRSSGVHVLLVNQQQRGVKPLMRHHPAWYTGRLEHDAVPVEFIDLDKLYYAVSEAKRINEELKGKIEDGEGSEG